MYIRSLGIKTFQGFDFLFSCPILRKNVFLSIDRMYIKLPILWRVNYLMKYRIKYLTVYQGIQLLIEKSYVELLFSQDVHFRYATERLHGNCR